MKDYEASDADLQTEVDHWMGELDRVIIDHQILEAKFERFKAQTREVLDNFICMPVNDFLNEQCMHCNSSWGDHMPDCNVGQLLKEARR